MRLIIGLMVVSWGLFGQTVPQLLQNGWIAGTVIPPTCASGVSATFFNYSNGQLYDCVNGVYLSRTILDVNGNLSIGNSTLDSVWSIKVPMTTVTTTPYVVANGGFFYCNRAGCVFTLPTISTAMVANGQSPRWCFFQDDSRSGVLQINASANTTISVDGAVASTPGNITSAGALGESVCLVARSVTRLHAIKGSGTWTNN